MKTKAECRYSWKERQAHQDACWYVDGDGHTWAATVTDGVGWINVFADGVMRFDVWNTNSDLLAGAESDHQIKTTDDLVAAGITNDNKLSKTEDRAEWFNNAWFDLYDGETGESLDKVHHTINEAIAEATTLLKKWHIEESGDGRVLGRNQIRNRPVR